MQSRLKEARAAAKPWLSQRDLADKLGVTGAAVSAWEAGVSVPRSDLLPQIARVLGVTVQYLVSGSESKEAA